MRALLEGGVPALAEMARSFPLDIKAGYWFDVQAWNHGAHGEVIRQDGSSPNYG